MPTIESLKQFSYSCLEGSENFYVVQIDSQGCYAYMNKHFKDIFVPKGETLIGKHFSVAVCTEDFPLTTEIAGQAMSEPGIPKKAVIRKIAKKKLLYTFWEFTCVVDKTGKPDALFCIGYDATETEKNLVTANNYLKQINDYLNSITDGFFTLNTKQDFVLINHFFEEIVSQQKETLVGQNYLDAFGDENKKEFQTAIETAIRMNKTVRFETLYVPNGNYYHVSIFPSKEGCLCYMKNINERKKAEIKIREQYEQLKEIAFLQSHELRAPLTNIMGIVNAVSLLEKDNTDPEIKFLLDALNTNAHKMDEIVRKIVGTANQNG